MSNFGRQQHLLRPDSRAGQTTGGGRFTHALSAAIKREEYSRPPLPPTASLGNHQPEEQLEEVEQKITLALQAIDANFDHCQRTMARDVMPKVERLAKLSSELLQASQPWLQFFMAVAAADDNEEEGEAARGLEDDEETRRGPMGVAQRAAIEEQIHKGDITARFPGEAEGMGRRQLEEWNNAGGAEDDDEPVDIDTEIATPQLTSRYMTQELGFAMSDVKSHATPTTPQVRTLKRSAEMFSGSAKKRKLGTPAKTTSQQANSRAGPSTPLSMMRALVHAKGRAGGGVGFRGVPGSGASHASKNSSSMGTDDLMPDTSPPHTTTFTLPKSRRIAVAHTPKGKTPLAGVYGFGEEDEDDDDILGEINSLINRYDSPKPPGSVAGSSVMGSTGMRSVARSEAPSSIGDMSALVNKYASPAEVVVKAEEAKRIQGLVADMEEMLGEVEAMARGGDEAEDDGDLESTGRVLVASAVKGGNAEGAVAAETDSEQVDDFDDIPSPPRISSDIDGAGVVVHDIPSSAPAIVAEAPAAAAVPARGLNPARRTFGGGGITRNVLHMDVEDMDTEDMTVGHLSPLANRGRIAAGVRPLQPPPQVSAPRFHALTEHDEDDPFGPTPERRRPTAVSRSSRNNDAPVSAQSERLTGAVNFAVPHSTRSWGGSAAVGSMQSSTTALGSEPTGTYDSSRLLHGGSGDLDTHTSDSAHLNESSLEFDGTTTILPTREMLQHAAAQAAESSSAMQHDDDGDTRNSVLDSPASSYSESMPLEPRSFDVELFPPAFRAAPAALQLRGLYDLIHSQDQRMWTQDDLVTELAAPTISDELRGAGAGVLVVLLDLLARRRLVRKVDDGLWTAH
ncbi:DASH complex subunit ask1 [Coemansia furcata]|uniref:DASH complex subunit ask1 n=1 Tax=Coemansia furcata TaxID=417177 RepID=A0ACC1LSF2_9FUNG|nr:DASH complex subunit ask1 [Coemansia furcata]